jgi:hypothetical protein
MIDDPFRQFVFNIQSARDLETIYIALNAMTANSVPKDEILRAELVLIVSAFDTYIHDIVLEVLRHKYVNGKKNSYMQHIITKNAIVSENQFVSKIRETHGFKTFQAPKKVSDAIGLLDIANIWSYFTSFPNIETTLSLIVQRRNHIAHESDINPANGLGEKWPIDLFMVQEVVKTIQTITRELDHIIQSHI